MNDRSRRGVALLGALLLCATPTAAAPVLIEARVIWLSGDQVYLGAPDSIAVQVDSRLTFLERGDTVATGEVTAVLDRTVARARITSGAIRGGKHMERLRILAEPARAPRVLRVGYPAPRRGADPLPCAQRSIAVDRQTHRVEALDRGLRITWLPGAPHSDSWPDTLIVLEFADAADQEIALERGDLDVGVFWPGELSSHMREHARWRDRLTGSAGITAAEVVCDPRLRPQVTAIGAQAFVELFRCDFGDPR